MKYMLVLLKLIYSRFAYIIGKAIDDAIVKLDEMDFGYQAELAKHGILKFIKLVVSEIKARPRIRLASKVIVILALIYLSATSVISYLEPKKAEVKIYGQQVLVAETNKVQLIEPEITEEVVARLSPFELVTPVENGYISQGYHAYHTAQDIATEFGTDIKPLGRGVVSFAGRVNNGKGNIVIIDHGDDLKSLYAHMGKINVAVGNMVNTHSSLGSVGLTGYTTGAHVHLEIYDNGRMVNPENVLPQ